ncbi:MAG: hypothetical protein ACE5GE_09255 [Phycisphaerae bacterium]
MRLRQVETGHTRKQNTILDEIRRMRGTVPDVLLTLHYRPDLFGGPFSELLQAVARGPSGWSVGQRELFAAFVSAKNACRY